jgi:cell surface protein SprA
LKGKSNFGTKLLLVILLGAAMIHAAARGHYAADPDPEPAPQPDSPSLRFPIKDRTGDPRVDGPGNPFDLKDPPNVDRSVDYNPTDNRYYLTEKMGNEFYRNPSYLTFEEYQKYEARQEEQNYWKRRLDALTLFNKQPTLPVMYKEGIFDRLFGNNTISVRPQGNVDITLGGNWQNIQNPTLPIRQRKYGIFDFNLDMNINLLAQIGDKMKLNISNNTKPTFDYQNTQKLEYTGKEDEIIKKIEAGNISFPLNTTLISGVQSLFGIKTQLQFGKLWITAALSQQKSKRNSLTVQGGSQTQTFGIKADDYEENKHFLLGQYFRNNYNTTLRNFPVISSVATISKIEVWVTNRTGATDGIRDVFCFMDLGEKNPYRPQIANPAKLDQPDNRSNRLYELLLQRPGSRSSNASTEISSIEVGPAPNGAALSSRLEGGTDFVRTTARKLNPSEFSYNPQLGYISLNTQVNTDDVLGVAYRYIYNGKVYQVGEFAEDLPPDTVNQKVMFLKLLKGQAMKPALPIWDLMMKNVYALGGIGVSKEDFRFNVLYQDPGGGEKRYIPDGPQAGVPLISLLNLDRLNVQNDPAPDGVFDYVEGITIAPQQGRIIFPVLEPFGEDLKPALGGDPQLERNYLYRILYDSTKTIARQFQQYNRFIMRGSYKSASSSEIFLGGFNIPQGSVSVTAGGQRLTENVDYQIDYGLGRLKILNTGVLNSGIPVNVQYEDNATFGFQQQNFMGARLDYYVNPKLTLGSTFMRLTERPFSQKTNYGEDPIKNTVYGVDGNYQSEFPGLTKLLDKLPIYSTTAPSFISASAEGATLRPGHPKQINSLDPEGAVYIDDFEGTRSAYDLKFPSLAWTLASVPVGARDRFNNPLFPEATLANNLNSARNRAKLSWYNIEPSLVDPVGGIPDFVKKDSLNQHYIRMVLQQDVFRQRTSTALTTALSTFDLTYYPQYRGPYNFDADGIDADGRLTNRRARWGGVMRPMDYSDFEQSNVEYIEFWLMDPFIGGQRPTSTGGSLYVNLGNISEDVNKDGRKFFENGIPYPKDTTRLEPTPFGYVPRFQQQITRAFDNSNEARAVQDVGYDGLDNEEEKTKFAQYLATLAGRFGPTSGAYTNAGADPAADDYRYFRDGVYEQAGTSVITRYRDFANPQGNSPVIDANATLSSAATTIPESEDIDRDNTLNETEDYYQYRVDLKPNMQTGTNFIVNKQTNRVKLPNGTFEDETWYQFKIPIREYEQKVGNIADFRSIRFMRMFLNDFQDSVTLRFAQLNLGRNQWRRYNYSLKNPGENIPDDEQRLTDFTVTSVSLEENSQRQPVNYVIPPGVNRQIAAQGNGQNIQQNEQALSLQVCALKDGDARAAFKEVNVDMRQFGRMRMFVHAEGQIDQPILRDGDLRAFIRIGSDFINNYYEYQIPLKVTPAGTTNDLGIWPEENNLDIALNDLVAVKTERNNLNLRPFVPYSRTDASGRTIVVVGNPNVGEAKTIMLGINNPAKTATTPGDDGAAKCAEVWFNELRMTGLNETPGYAATAKVDLQLADLGSLHVGGSMHTMGYGNIDQKVNQRKQDNYYQYDANANLQLGKLMPKSWGVQLPLYVANAKNVSTPKFNPYDLDVNLRNQIDGLSGAARDSLRDVAQDATEITSVNLSNVRITGNPESNKRPKPWSAKNFDLSYAYNSQVKRNPTIATNKITTNRLGLGYSYSIRTKPFEPFRSLIRSRSKWWGLIKDFNITPLPSNIGFRSDMNRIMEETKVRNLETDGAYDIPSTFYKNFTWLRTYTVRWELTRSLSFDYNASNMSRIDEPYGKIDNASKRDSLWKAVSRFGRNTLYTQALNASYKVPFSKLPITDWMSLTATYASTYSWTAASRLAESLGNTITNTQTKTLNGELNFTQLYNKNRFLRAVNQPKRRAPKNNSKAAMRGKTVKAGAPGNELTEEGKNGKNAMPDPSIETAPKTNNNPPVLTPKKGERPSTLNLNGVMISTASMSDHQLDSLTKLIKADEQAKAKAARAKKKQDRKLARKQRRNKPAEVNGLARVAGQLLTMVKRGTLNYSENGGTILPGYMDSTKVFGVNTSNGDPGLGFAFGSQPATSYLDRLSGRGKMSRDSLFNAQFQQTYSQNLNIAAQVEPIPNDLRIDLTLTKTFIKSHTEIYKDTTASHTGLFSHNNPYETGNYNISYIALKTLFQSGGVNAKAYQDFLVGRKIVSGRLGNVNPYTNGVINPSDPEYKKGYGRFSQDALIPAFIAAYSGRDAETIPLLDYSNTSIKSNPFHNYYPLPNWRINYTGLSKLPIFNDIFTNLVINDAYTGNLSVSSFATSLYYQDAFGVGFPSFLDSISGNYVPFFQVPNITISEQFGPLLGIDASLRNGLTGRVEYRKNRTVSLSLIDYQISETHSSELVIGAGYRIRGLRLPFEILGVKKLDNDLNIKVDIGYRDDKTSNAYLAQDYEVITRGQKVITISPSVDYIVNDRVTLRLFYDRRQSIPYTTQSYPTTTTKAGITLRFIFAQ